MSSARSITAAVNPPRAVYLDYPLGHTSGKPEDAANQMAVMRDTLAAFASIDAPGTIIDLEYEWREDDSWKDRVMRPEPQDASASSGDGGSIVAVLAIGLPIDGLLLCSTVSRRATVAQTVASDGPYSLYRATPRITAL